MAESHVWWTIPGSGVAWEWLPDGAVVRSGRFVSEGAAWRFHATQAWAPMWTSEETRASFQAFKDLTALFAEETNVLPADMRIFWITGERAVSWCRSTGRLWRHDVLASTEPAGAPAAGETGPREPRPPSVRVPGAAAAPYERAGMAVSAGKADGSASDLRAADTHAREVLAT